MEENRAAGDEVVSFTVSDGDLSVMASQLAEVVLVGTDSDFFTANITSPNTGKIYTKFVYEISIYTCVYIALYYIICT